MKFTSTIILVAVAMALTSCGTTTATKLSTALTQYEAATKDHGKVTQADVISIVVGALGEAPAAPAAPKPAVTAP